ncbi:MAG: hypothetical protein WB579_17610 [Bryobacteraceae bacterium]
MRSFLSSFAVSIICIPWLPCVAQEVAPVIYLSTAESAKAKQAAEDLKGAQDRDRKATAAWQDFYQTYQRAHPELPALRFASDFRVAFARQDSAIPQPLSSVASAVVLSEKERQDAASLHREMEEAKAALLQAQRNWEDNWHQLVLDHFSMKPNEGGIPVQLPGGKSGLIQGPWVSGVIFTPDYRVGVPW